MHARTHAADPAVHPLGPDQQTVQGPAPLEACVKVDRPPAPHIISYPASFSARPPTPLSYFQPPGHAAVYSCGYALLGLGAHAPVHLVLPAYALNTLWREKIAPQCLQPVKQSSRSLLRRGAERLCCRDRQDKGPAAPWRMQQAGQDNASTTDEEEEDAFLSCMLRHRGMTAMQVCQAQLDACVHAPRWLAGPYVHSAASGFRLSQYHTRLLPRLYGESCMQATRTHSRVCFVLLGAQQYHHAPASCQGHTCTSTAAGPPSSSVWRIAGARSLPAAVLGSVFANSAVAALAMRAQNS